MRTFLSYENLPLWRGLQSDLEPAQNFPLSLGWDERGFIRQTTPEEIQESIVQAYAEDYTHITPPPGHSAWASRLGMQRLEFSRAYLGDIRSKKVLELGAGSLHLARKMQAEDHIGHYTIVDPSVREERRADEQIEVIRDFFGADMAAQMSDSFDLVFAFSILEHVPDPLDMLFAIQSVLKPESGRAVVVLPDAERQFLCGDLTCLTHEHISCFTDSMSRHLFSAAGLEVEHQERGPDILSYVLSRAIDAGEIEHQKPEDEICRVAEDSFPAALRYADDLLRACIAANEPFAIHGATNGLDVLLHLIGENDYRSALLFDGDESKAGKFIPSFPHAIRHTTDETYKSVQTVLVAATTFYDEIRADLIDGVGLSTGQIKPLFPLNPKDLV